MKNKSASNLGKLSRAKRLKQLEEKGITESQHMSQVRKGSVDKSKKGR